MKQKMANELRFLCADMVQKANSGHPGAPMGLSEVVVALSKKLRHNPRNPKWLKKPNSVFTNLQKPNLSRYKKIVKRMFATSAAK